MSHVGLINDGSYDPVAALEKLKIGVNILKYPAGEPQLSLSKQFLVYTSNTGVFDARCLGVDYCNVSLLAQAGDIINHAMPEKRIKLYLPYMPFSRQDRRVSETTSSALKVFAKMVNAMGFSGVKTMDAHSDVCEAVFDHLDNHDNKKLVQMALAAHAREAITFLSPDAGAAKKIPSLIQSLDTSDITISTEYAQKHREVLTGKITHTSVPDGLGGADIIIVDDICDGGRTFIEIAKALPQDTTKHLVVTHGIFSQGTDVIFDHFDTVTTTDSFPQTDTRLGILKV